MKPKKNIRALCLSMLILLNSCRVYTGSYRVDDPVLKDKEVKVKFRSYDYLEYNNNQYVTIKNRDFETWTLIKTDSSKTSDVNPRTFGTIVFMDSVYYGTDHLSDRNAWMEIKPAEIVEIPNTKSRYFKRIITENGKFYGVNDTLDLDQMVPLKEDQVIKISKLSTALTITVSLIAVPVVSTLLIAYLITELNDDYSIN